MTDDHSDIAYRSNPKFSFNAHQSLPRRADQQQHHRAIEHIIMTDDDPHIAYRLNPSFSFNAQQSLPRRAHQQQQQQQQHRTNEDLVTTDGLYDIAYRSNSKFSLNAQQQSLPRRAQPQQRQRQQANEDLVMIDSLPVVPYRRSQFVKPIQRLSSSAPRRNIYTVSDNDTDSANDACRHSKPILWDDLYGPRVPKSLVSFIYNFTRFRDGLVYDSRFLFQL